MATIHNTARGVFDDPFGILKDIELSVNDSSWQNLQDGYFDGVMGGRAALGDDEMPDGGPKWERCRQCSCAMEVRGFEFVCADCSYVSDGPLDIEVNNRQGSRNILDSAMRVAPRLRMVGPSCSYYQRDLDRATTVEYSEIQRRHVMQELLAYNETYRERGGKCFPRNVLEDTALAYNQVQKHYVKRSQMKQTLLAAILKTVCNIHKFTRTNPDIADFMQLQIRGVAKGTDFLRSMQADKQIDINVDEDRLHGHITSTFALLDLISEDDPSYPTRDNSIIRTAAIHLTTGTLRSAIVAVVRTAEEKKIGTKSEKPSKVIAAAYELLRRAGCKILLDNYAQSCNIRKNTISRFTLELLRYHSYFKDIYTAHGLMDSC